MGKRLIQQRRGRVRGHFNVPSHRFKDEVKYIIDQDEHTGVVEDILHDPGHTAPIATVRLDDGRRISIIASEGIAVKDVIKFSENREDIAHGNVLPVGVIQEGIPIYNIEISPGDGGKLVRTAGSNAIVVSHDSKKTVIQLPSGRFKTLNSKCRATVGVVAGGGRSDKPFLKAGKKFRAFRARGKQYPIVRGVAMNPVAHPHGGGSHQHVGKPSTVKRGASPGRKVGSIAAKKTGGK